MDKRLILICLILGITVKLCESDRKAACNMTISDADQCASKLMFIGDRNNFIPSNDDEMNQYCSRMQEGIRCIRRYAKACLPAFPQQVFGMFAYDAKTMIGKQCRAVKERSEFVRHVSCFIPKPYMDPLHVCVDQYVAQLEVIKTYEPNWRIPGTCCTFHVLQDCIHKQTIKLCESKTGIETVDYIMDIINGVTDDVLDFTCGPYKSVEQCDQLMKADIWQKVRDIVDSDATKIRNNHKYMSPVPLLVSIITDFEM